MADDTSIEGGEQPQVQILVDERELRTLYSNSYRIHTALEEVVLDIGFNMANPNQQQGTWTPPVQRPLLSHTFLKTGQVHRTPQIPGPPTAKANVYRNSFARCTPGSTALRRSLAACLHLSGPIFP